MKLVPYDAKQLKWHRLGSNQALIQEFLDSGHDCVKVENFTQNTARNAQSNISVCLKRMGVRNVRAICRGNNLFLLKIDI